MDIELTADDISMMRAEIRRFCQKSIQPLVERPERAIEAEQLAQLTRQAAEIGLINPSLAPGTGLWENPDSQGWNQLSLSALHAVGRVNAGIAFHFHQLALGRYVSRCLGIDGGYPSIVCVQGSYGLARCSLARLLKGTDLSDADRALLRDYFVTLDSDGENLPVLFQAADCWQQLLVPCFNGQHDLGWAAFNREDIRVSPLPNSHGLDETRTWQWQPRGESPLQSVAHEIGIPLYAKVLGLDAQALIVIALGAVESGHEKAAEYAALRKQAGRPIGEHAAVRQMLARCASTIRIGELLREQLSRLPVSTSPCAANAPGRPSGDRNFANTPSAAELTGDPATLAVPARKQAEPLPRPRRAEATDRLGIGLKDNLGTIFAVRAQMHSLICAAANDALQVFGGSGYTREVGLEKIVRDCNHLRLLCGTPDELLMFVSEWEND